MRFLHGSLVVLLAVALVVAFTSPPASAATEMIPGSRLIFPYVDIVSGRNTFLLITNVSSTISAPTHLTFYGQSCQRSDQPIFLTPDDIAAVDVQVALGNVSALPVLPQPSGGKFTNADGIGWVDVDVRDPANNRDSPGFEFNGLIGLAVLIDVQKDFAFAYPAAASQGSAAGGFTTTTAVINSNTRILPNAQIVTRSGGDVATVWTGTYETYNSHIYIPGFFAEDACAAASPTLTAFIAIAGPADGFRKEAPGSQLGTGTILVNVTGDVFDGVENDTSIDGFGHLLNSRLCTAFPTTKPRPYLNPPAAYASVDITLGATNSIGWMDMDNTADSPTGSASGPGPSNANFTTVNGFNTSSRKRGIVAILFEIQASDPVPIPPGSFSLVKTGDAIRNWNNPFHSSSPSVGSTSDWNCFGTPDILGGVGTNGPVTCSNGVFSNWVSRHTQQ